MQYQTYTSTRITNDEPANGDDNDGATRPTTSWFISWPKQVGQIGTLQMQSKVVSRCAVQRYGWPEVAQPNLRHLHHG
jgi:hypothetical protein